MKYSSIIILAFIPMLAGATTIDDLRARDPAACKGMTLEDNYSGILICAGRLADRSQQKLQARLAEIRLELAKINFAEYTAAFELSQNTWEKYKDEYCAFKITGIDKHKPVYVLNLDVCHALENNRRLDTLKHEPSIT